MKLIVSGLDEAPLHRGKISHFLAMVDPEDAGFIPDLGISPQNRHYAFCHDITSQAEARDRESADKLLERDGRLSQAILTR
jgi:hypothetical protein